MPHQSDRHLTRTFAAKLAILVAAVAAAVFLTIWQPSPASVGGREVRAAPGTPAAKVKKSNYDLSKMTVFNQTLVKIHDNYVDQTRIDPKQMLVKALESVQRNIAEVLVEPHLDKDEIIVTVNDKTKSFSTSDVESLWRLAGRLKEIFRFIQANMNPASDPAQIEYAAINGMLGTLDPHSVLLDPESAREMDISTSGKFGGIGIVIGMRKGKLVVIKLIDPSTPAAKVGLKAGDHIVKINDEPTVNLTLTEAMNRLRGDPNTKVSVTIDRKGMAAPTAFQITRDQIRVSVVEGRMLSSGNIGYLKIESFQSQVTSDLRKVMDQLKKQGAKGWVLDLRYNPGGLLDQAVKVSDLFVDTGTLVTTVGYAGKERKEERADADGNDSKLPLVVLVNGGSASASEIVAGALKNLDRAVIIGRTTFGKGSVQVLFDFDDNSKLKLTIAQYLTPGDVSIQGVGITPDIELVPAIVPDAVKDEKSVVRLSGNVYRMREADLDAHLTSKNVRKEEKPGESVRYLYVKPKGSAVEDDATDESGQPILDEETPPDEFVEDFEIQFARDFVAQAASSRRKDALSHSKQYITKRKGDEESKISAALAKLTVDWTAEKATGAKLTATVTTDKPKNEVRAGEVIAITGSVSNTGTAAAYRVHGIADASDYTFEDTELSFGKIGPGETKTFTTYVRVGKDAESRMDSLEWKFTEANGAKVDVAPTKVAIVGLDRPAFAYAYQIIDETGNGDGQVQLGESFKLHVTVKNIGTGKGSEEVTAMLRNDSGDGVIVNKGRFPLNGIAPGATQTFDFTFDVKKDVKADTTLMTEKELVMELSVYDAELREGVNEKLKFPLRNAAAGPKPESGVVKVSKKDAVVHEGASADATVVGTVKKGSTLKVTGRDGDWVRVEVAPGRPGFVASADVSKASGGPSKDAFTQAWQVTPPTLALQVPSLETVGDMWQLTGTATDDHHVEDVFVIVSNRDSKVEGKKVFYVSNRGKKADAKLDFSTKIPVWPGNNMVTVIARENNEVRSAQTVFIYRTDGQRQASATK